MPVWPGRDRENHQKQHMWPLFFSVYIAPEARGNGVAKNLIQAIYAEVEKKPAIVKVDLIGKTENETAKKLYGKCGFEFVALLKKS